MSNTSDLIEQLKAENARLKVEVGTLEQENQTLCDTLSDLKSDNQSLQQQLNASSARIDQLKAQMEEFPL